MRFSTVVLAIGLAAPWLTHALEKTLDPKHPIEAIFSLSCHNRITVEEGSVEKIFADSSVFSVTIDPATGNAFVNVLKEIKDHPAALSIVTSSGMVQDLLITSRPGMPEQVLLHEPEEIELLPKIPSLGRAAEVIQQIFEYKDPSGYVPSTSEIPLELPSPLETELIASFEDPFENLSLYRLENPGKHTVVLSPDALSEQGKVWVLFNRPEIHPKEEALCLVGRLKEETLP